jgi:hypothetical protein
MGKLNKLRSLLCSAALALGAVSMLASLQGCVTRPTMHLNHAEVRGLQLTLPPSVQMVIVVDVHNPNSFDVAVRAMRGTITLAGKYPLAVNFVPPGEGQWLASDAITPLRIPVAIPLDVALKISLEAVSSPTIPFRFSGKADVTASRTFKVDENDYAMDEVGQITRAQLMAILPNSLPGAQPSGPTGLGPPGLGPPGLGR